MRPADDRQYYCYVYRDPDTRVARHVGAGKTGRSFASGKRARNQAVTAWEAGLAAQGKPIIVEIVKTNGPITQVEAWALERSLIELYGRESDGGTLLNKRLGGPYNFMHKRAGEELMDHARVLDAGKVAA
jgi:hypothetical protein